MAAPTTDGTNTGGSTGSTTATATVTTTLTNDVVVVIIDYNRVGASVTTGVSSVTATGLTFTKRGGAGIATSTGWYGKEIWWAPAAAVQSANTITVTFANSTDNTALEVFAVNGVNNINSPWDTNGSLPAFTTQAVDNAQPAAPTYSTSQANDLLIASGGGPAQDANSWTTLVSKVQFAGTYQAYGVTWSNGVTSTQSSVTSPFTASGGTVAVRYSDALTADASGGGGGASRSASLLLLRAG